MQRRQDWNDFVIKHGGSFLQSWEWGVFQEKIGRKAFRIAVPEENPVIAGQIIEHELPFGLRYFYIPRGPVGDWQLIGDWLHGVKKIADEKKVFFIRIEPPLTSYQLPSTFINTGRAIQPRQNLVIDLQKSEDELLASMHEKTRYNMRVAVKHGIAVEQKQDSDAFLRLVKETATQQKLRTYSDSYYRTLAEVFLENAQGARGVLFMAVFGQKPLSAAFSIGFGKRLTYLHGGSSRERKEVMAPYALHWEIMRWAKQNGYLEYDMGGIDEVRWLGLTRFKKGFGGRVEEFSPAYELPFDKVKYAAYRLTRRLIK